MWIKSFVLVALAVVLAVPGVGAQGFTATQTPIEYETPVITIRTADGSVAETEFDVPVIHDLAVLNRTSIFVVTVNAQTDSSAVGGQVADFQLVIDGGDLTDCAWRFAGGTFISETSSGVHLRCANGTGVGPGTHSVAVTVNVVQGGNPVDQATVTVTLIQLEVTTTTTNFEVVTGLTALEFFVFPVIAFLGILIWSRSTDLGARAFGSVLCIVSGVLLLVIGLEAGLGSVWQGTVPMVFILTATGIYLLTRMFVDVVAGESVDPGGAR